MEVGLYFFYGLFNDADSSVAIAAGWTAGARDFFLLHSVQIDSGAHPDFYPLGTGDSSPGGKAARA
jgi:hypothetical protein